MLRYRGKKLSLNIVKELDSFPKVQEEIYEQSTYSNVICKNETRLLIGPGFQC